MAAGFNIAQYRRDSRVTAVLPIKIAPQDDPAKLRPACTCEVSSKGAKLMKVEGLGEGDVIWISRHTRRAKFKVSWIGKQGSELDGQIGVESLEPDKFIWDDDLRSRLS